MALSLKLIMIIIILLLNIAGIIGSLIPAIPGLPISLLALIIAYFYFHNSITLTLLIVIILLSLVVIALDSLAPGIMAKMGGGSKYAAYGATLGMIIGLFIKPVGVVWVPLIGAFIGEYISNPNFYKSIKVAFLTFSAFMLATGLKVILCLIIMYYSMKACL